MPVVLRIPDITLKFRTNRDRREKRNPRPYRSRQRSPSPPPAPISGVLGKATFGARWRVYRPYQPTPRAYLPGTVSRSPAPLRVRPHLGRGSLLGRGASGPPRRGGRRRAAPSSWPRGQGGVVPPLPPDPLRR